MDSMDSRHSEGIPVREAYRAIGGSPNGTGTTFTP